MTGDPVPLHCKARRAAGSLQRCAVVAVAWALAGCATGTLQVPAGSLPALAERQTVDYVWTQGKATVRGTGEVKGVTVRYRLPTARSSFGPTAVDDSDDISAPFHARLDASAPGGDQLIVWTGWSRHAYVLADVERVDVSFRDPSFERPASGEHRSFRGGLLGPGIALTVLGAALLGLGVTFYQGASQLGEDGAVFARIDGFVAMTFAVLHLAPGVPLLIAGMQPKGGVGPAGGFNLAAMAPRSTPHALGFQWAFY